MLASQDVPRAGKALSASCDNQRQKGLTRSPVDKVFQESRPGGLRVTGRESHKQSSGHVRIGHSIRMAVAVLFESSVDDIQVITLRRPV